MNTAVDRYVNASTTRNIDGNVHSLIATYDEEDDMESFKSKFQRHKKPIYMLLIFLVVVIVGVCIGVSLSSSSSSTASTESALKDTPASSLENPATTAANSPSTTAADSTSTIAANTPSTMLTNCSTPVLKNVLAPVSKDALASVSTNGLAPVSKNASAYTLEDTTQTSMLDSDADAVESTKDSAQEVNSAGEDLSVGDQNLLHHLTNDSSPNTVNQASPQSVSGPTLAYILVSFDWTDASKWEYTSGANVSSDTVTKNGITLTPKNSGEPIRTIEGWSGEKVVYIEWERTSTSDTNIWMLNTKLQSQFGKGNGWPYWGELDLFEMFTQDAISIPAYDYSGFGGFSDVSSYGQLTMHMGPAVENGSPCFCPSSPSKNLWYDNAQPMTSSCTAQFSNDESNSIAAVWGSDSKGQYIQLIQKPILTKGGKLNGVDTYDVAIGSGGVTSKIYNNAELFWGVDATEPCAQAGGHDAASGFPFFENFRLVLEEQTKNDPSASFTVKNIQIFTKN
ncbi:unnamed protein product [Peronospora belbahrii]|uniref:GH16 domain-containing protein n=1 Tax=Peronospora belbahrii TaxID=622444 RepID=A0ABN8D0I0_9STRA|nr:unnamed protein product [Peronospora belbahrii]